MGFGHQGRYLGAVEVAAVRVREPARPTGALVNDHVPQLNVHPHDTPENGMGSARDLLVSPTQRGHVPPLPLGQ